MWKNRLFLALAWVGRWLSLLAPIALVIWFNRDIYFKDQIATYKIFAAFAFAGAVIVPIIEKRKSGLPGLVLCCVALDISRFRVFVDGFYHQLCSVSLNIYKM